MVMQPSDARKVHRHEQQCPYHKRMRMHHQATVLAVGTEVEVSALHTSEALPRLNLHAAVVAGASKGRSVWVV